MGAAPIQDSKTPPALVKGTTISQGPIATPTHPNLQILLTTQWRFICSEFFQLCYILAKRRHYSNLVFQHCLLSNRPGPFLPSPPHPCPHTQIDCFPNPNTETYYIFFFICDCFHVMTHEDNSQNQVNNSKTRVQPKKIVTVG